MEGRTPKEPTLRKSFTFQKEVTCACPYGNLEYLAAGLVSGLIYLLPIDSSKSLKKLIGHKTAVTCIESCGSDPHLVSGSADGTVRIWVGNEQADSWCLNVSKAPITSLSLSPHFDTLVVASQGAVSVWDPQRCQKIIDFQPQSSNINTVSISADSLVAVTGSDSGELTIYDLRSGTISRTLNLKSPIYSTSIRQSGSSIAAGCLNGTVHLWDCRTQTFIVQTPLHHEKVTSLSFHPTLPFLLSASDDTKIAVCNADTRGLIFTLECHTEGVKYVRWSEDGHTFSSCGSDKRAVIWDEPVWDVPITQPVTVNHTQRKYPTPQKLGRFNKPIPRSPSPDPQPEVENGIQVKCEEAETMKKYIGMMHTITGQIATLSQMLSKIEGRMNAMDEQIAILEKEKRKQAKIALKGRK